MTDTLEGAVAIAHTLMKHMGNGELAELRRANPAEPYSPALWKVLVSLPDCWTVPQNERTWGVVLQGLAKCLELHSSTASLGAALARAEYSELRLTRLLRADQEQLFREINRLAGYIASKHVAVDWTDVARLCFYNDSELASQVRRGIARAYYRNIDRTHSHTEQEA